MSEQFLIIVSGPPAVGKTATTRTLMEEFEPGFKISLLQGDFIAHLIKDCNYSEDELDLKYTNMSSLIQNLEDSGYSVLVDDFIRREKDREMLLKASNSEVIHTIKLTAPTSTLLDRNRDREEWEWMSDSELIEKRSQFTSLEDEWDKVINTKEKSVFEVKDELLDLIDCSI